MTPIPEIAQDVTKHVRAGYMSPPDRIPASQSLEQMAFAVGRNFLVRGLACPGLVHAWDDPILGTFFYCISPAGALLVQPWPHPQTGGRYLITATAESPGGDPATKPCPDCGGFGCETCQRTGRLPLKLSVR